MGETRSPRGRERETSGAVRRLSSRDVRAMLAGIVQSSDDAIISTDLRGVITTWNAAAERLYGYAANDAIGRSIEMIVPPEHSSDLDPVRERLRAGQHIERQEALGVHKDGRRIDISFTMSPIVGEHGRMVGTASITRDVTEQRRAREALEESERRFRMLFATNPQPMWVFDAETLRFLEVNDAAVDRYGYSRSEFLAMRITDIRSSDEAQRLLQELPALGTSIRHSGEWRHCRRDGSVIDVEIVAHPLEFSGRPTVLVLAQDVTERKRVREELRRQALHDALTGLPNRTLLTDRLDQAILITRRTGEPVTLLVMDLDGFKEINDTFGHGHGDQLLQQLGARLRKPVRDSDTVARLGGDEFAVILPATDADGAMRTVHAMHTALEEPFCVEEKILSVGASIGIAVCPDHGDTSSALLRHADVAMYVAKREHTGHALYSPERDRHNATEFALAGSLREAIEHDQLVLHYQPTFSVHNGTVEKVEALVRWNHPEQGLIAPAEFIPIAERIGLIRPLTRWVLRAALRQCRIWYDSGRNVNVSVNLSARNLQEDDLVDTVRHLIRQCAISPTWLTVEITETTIMADPDRAMQVLTGLHGLGIHISIDDFGTGYSSLAYLKRLPVDEIKIDRSFVQEMRTNESDAVIVRSVIDLGHNLGLRVVAEGVENGATVEMLSSMRCDLVQGFFLGRPEPANGGHARVGETDYHDTHISTSARRDPSERFSAAAAYHAGAAARLSG
ncbi:MAG: EAL domain-containing protein [Chloroflexota bacterium]